MTVLQGSGDWRFHYTKKSRHAKSKQALQQSSLGSNLGYYDPSIGRFLSKDPAHAGSNWYVYCNNKPITAIDPSGLRLIPPSDPVERRDFYIALWYLSIDPEYRRMIRELERSPVDHTIRIVHNGDDHFDPNDQSIQWDPNSALRTTDGGRQTPALGLGHEMDHAWGSDNGLPPKAYDPQYEDTEERRVISGRERSAAGRFGESPRSNHAGTPYIVHGPLNRYH